MRTTDANGHGKLYALVNTTAIFVQKKNRVKSDWTEDWFCCESRKARLE